MFSCLDKHSIETYNICLYIDTALETLEDRIHPQNVQLVGHLGQERFGGPFVEKLVISKGKYVSRSFGEYYRAFAIVYLYTFYEKLWLVWESY